MFDCSVEFILCVFFGYKNKLRILIEIEGKENSLCLVLKIGNLKGLVKI